MGLREVRRLFSDVDLAKNPNVGTNGKRPWLEADLWAADFLTAPLPRQTPGWRSPYKVFFSLPPELQIVLLFQPGMMRVVLGT